LATGPSFHTFCGLPAKVAAGKPYPAGTGNWLQGIGIRKNGP
jgi:hypothetical protein